MVIMTRCRVQFDNNIRFEESMLISTYNGHQAPRSMAAAWRAVIGGGDLRGRYRWGRR